MDGGEKDDDYLAKTVVPFLNNKDNIYGSLSCTIFTPESKGKMNDSKGLQHLQQAIATLQYGCICINQIGIFGYFSAVRGGVWGGHPHEEHGQSGNGFIGDLYGLVEKDRHAKVVVYGPSLENKPQFDLADNPPAILFDILMELTCTPSIMSGIIGVHPWSLSALPLPFCRIYL